MNLNEKKEELKQEIINNKNNYIYPYIILNFIDNETSNNLIKKITDKKTKENITSIIQKNFLTGNQHFLKILSTFIFIFYEDFYFLFNNSEYIIKTLIHNNKYNKFLFSKKYIGNNENINYYYFNIKRLIVNGFYTNIKELSPKSELIKKFAKKNNIKTKKDMLLNKKDIDILYNSLIKIALCNAKELNNILLFEDIKKYIKEAKNQQPKNTIINHYLDNWNLMIKNYYNKEKILTELLK